MLNSSYRPVSRNIPEMSYLEKFNIDAEHLEVRFPGVLTNAIQQTGITSVDALTGLGIPHLQEHLVLPGLRCAIYRTDTGASVEVPFRETGRDAINHVLRENGEWNRPGITRSGLRNDGRIVQRQWQLLAAALMAVGPHAAHLIGAGIQAAGQSHAVPLIVVGLQAAAPAAVRLLANGIQEGSQSQALQPRAVLPRSSCLEGDYPVFRCHGHNCPVPS
ncbi:uncharacterized protein LOC129598332 [Paramacrobiotus metropolitanus]|uniref:uncharacterized protein LOC129598332 n=1 Tax=Paramacrobiotus metropolitanus TaxID=2943436 RepID=UPI00244596E2|nr:uncharacterized protein LOC129598332 [Paramacrobiotus metropolitanus]